jgi:transposase
MNIAALLGLPPRLEGVTFEVTGEQVVVQIEADTTTASCLTCTYSTSRIHSHYLRTIADVPSGGHQSVLRLQARKFFCDNTSCPRKVFAERFTPFVAP